VSDDDLDHASSVANQLRVAEENGNLPDELADEDDQLRETQVLSDLHEISGLSWIGIANREVDLLADLDERTTSRISVAYRVRLTPPARTRSRRSSPAAPVTRSAPMPSTKTYSHAPRAASKVTRAGRSRRCGISARTTCRSWSTTPSSTSSIAAGRSGTTSLGLPDRTASGTALIRDIRRVIVGVFVDLLVV